MSVKGNDEEKHIMRLISLNGLRFFFFISVFFSHLIIIRDLKIIGFEKIYKYLFDGINGVTFFFILSGFMISYGYESKMKNKEVSSIEFFFIE